MQHTVHVIEKISAPIQKVWEKIRDFNGLDNFHPAIKKSEIEDNKNPEEVGCIRYLTLESGFVREELLKLDDENYELDYTIIESSLPMENYKASMRLKQGNAAETICEWWANFDVPEGTSKQEMINLVRDNVFKVGFKALAETI